jgi:trans-aconitate 2-methyltransferase
MDLLFSNAALHWLDDHATLLPRMLSLLAPDGVLALQMPAQHDAASLRIGYVLAASPRFAGRLAPLVRRNAVHEPERYYAIVKPLARTIDVWSTEYLQALDGENPVAEFTKGSFVGVWLAALPPAEAQAFERDYRAAIAAAYPRRPDGTTLFPFRRLFMVARRFS